jgi:hypothetical protein
LEPVYDNAVFLPTVRIKTLESFYLLLYSAVYCVRKRNILRAPLGTPTSSRSGIAVGELTP